MNRQIMLMAMFVSAALSSSLAAPAGYSTDKGTISFLRYNLVSGDEFTFPAEALKQKLSGSGFFLMRLRPDGAVQSITTKMSSKVPLLDAHITRTLKTYRFKPGTKQPIEWLVGFAYPSTVIVKLNLVKDDKSAVSPNRILFGEKVH